MAENLPKRQTPNDAKWLSLAQRLHRREGVSDISNELDFKDVIDKAVRDALEQVKWAMSQFQRGCTNKINGLRAECWAPDVEEMFKLPGGRERNREILQPNHTYYVHTNQQALTFWLEDATKSDGECIEVKDVDGNGATNNIVIKTLKGQKIDGASSFTISASYGSAIFRSNGQQWYSIARKNSADAAGTVTNTGTLTNDRVIVGTGGVDVEASTLSFASGVLEDTASNDIVVKAKAGQASTFGRVAAADGTTIAGTVVRLGESGATITNTGTTVMSQPTVGTVVHETISTATNSDPRSRNRQARTTTTGITPVTLHTFSLADAGTYCIEVRVLARATTSGVGVAVGDAAAYKLFAVFRNVGGTVTQVGTTDKVAKEDTSMAGADAAFAISGTNVTLDVTGITDTFAQDEDVAWHMTKGELDGPLES